MATTALTAITAAIRATTGRRGKRTITMAPKQTVASSACPDGIPSLLANENGDGIAGRTCPMIERVTRSRATPLRVAPATNTAPRGRSRIQRMQATNSATATRKRTSPNTVTALDGSTHQPRSGVRPIMIRRNWLSAMCSAVWRSIVTSRPLLMICWTTPMNTRKATAATASRARRTVDRDSAIGDQCRGSGPSPRFGGQVSPVEYHHIEPAEAFGVGEHLDLDDSPVGDRERKDDPRPASHRPYQAGIAVDESGLCCLGATRERLG